MAYNGQTRLKLANYNGIKYLGFIFVVSTVSVSSSFFNMITAFYAAEASKLGILGRIRNKKICNVSWWENVAYFYSVTYKKAALKILNIARKVTARIPIVWFFIGHPVKTDLQNTAKLRNSLKTLCYQSVRYYEALLYLWRSGQYFGLRTCVNINSDPKVQS